MLEKIKQFKKIDAHSHVGHFGGWPNVSITPEELIRQMDEYNVEKAVICTFPMEESIAAVDQYPDRFIGAAWVNPMEKDAVSQIRSAVEDLTDLRRSNCTPFPRVISPMTNASSPSRNWRGIWIFL